MIRLVILAACAFLAGCATSPAKTVFAAKTAFATVEAGALVYAQLPRCGVNGAVAACANGATVQSVVAGANATKATLDAAEKVVRDPNAPKSSALQWAKTAQASVAALRATLPASAPNGN